MSNELLLERYKYVLDQKKNLNSITFKVATIYQGAVIIIAAGQFKLIENSIVSDLWRESFEFFSRALFCMTLGVSFFCLAALLSGIFSWFSYRNEEVLILREEIVQQKSSSIWRIMRWYETYIILAMIVVCVSHFTALELYIIPKFGG